MSLELLQDIHLSDDSFWTDFQYYWKNGSYSRALQILEENQELVTKYVTAEWFNALTALVYQLETLPDDFNKKQIKVSYLPPDLEVGDIWFQLELGEVNIGVKMSIIPAGSTSVTTTYSNTLINALAFKNNEEVLVDQIINETNHSVTFSIGESLDYPVICMVYSSNNSSLIVTTTEVSIGTEMLANDYSGRILSVMFLQNNIRNIITIYDYNSNQLFFKMNPITENGVIRICSIPNANLNEILNVSSGTLSNTVLSLACDGYMVGSVLTQAETLELGINNVSGSVVTFNDGVGGMALKSLTVNIDPVQEGTGDPSPDNVRPISGWNAVNVWRTGKNLLRTTAESKTQNGITFTVNADGTIHVSGTSTAQTSLVIGRYTIKEADTYYYSGTPSGGSSSTYRTYLSWGGNEVGGGASKALTVGTSVSATISINTGVTIDATFKPMLCKMSDGTDYEPYSGNQFTIYLGQTVYSGTLDVVTGELVVDRAMHIVTAEELQLVGTTAQGIQYLQPNGNTLTDAKTGGQKASNMYITNTSLNNGTWRVLNGRYYIYDNRFSDLETAKAIVTETEIQLVYELATPITIPLTPTQISTLLGTNNIWADTGDTSLQYYTTSDSPSSTEELTVENFVLSDISFDLNKAIISKDSNDSTIKCTLYYT